MFNTRPEDFVFGTAIFTLQDRLDLVVLVVFLFWRQVFLTHKNRVSACPSPNHTPVPQPQQLSEVANLSSIPFHNKPRYHVVSTFYDVSLCVKALILFVCVF